MTTLTLYLAGSAEPFAAIRPELAPRLGPVILALLGDIKADGLQVRTEPEDWLPKFSEIPLAT